MINGKVIHLADGTEISARVNFLVIYEVQMCHIEDLYLKAKGDPAKGIDPDPDAEMEACAEMIRIVFAANGKDVSKREALRLLDIDNMDEIEEVFEDFSRRLENYKKKQDAKLQMQVFTSGLT